MSLKIPHIQKRYPIASDRKRVLELFHSQPDPARAAWRLMELENQIRSVNFVDRVKFFNDLLIQPLFTCIFWIGMFVFPSILLWFGMDLEFSKWNLFLWSISGYQTASKFIASLISLIEYQELYWTFFQWKVITHANRGPFITGPQRYSYLLYADAIARIKASLASDSLL